MPRTATVIRTDAIAPVTDAIGLSPSPVVERIIIFHSLIYLDN